MKRSMVIAAALGLLLAGCAKRKRVTPVPAAPAAGTIEEGIASWYGHPYHGRASSSGEIYDMEQMTAAHRTLPFGTRVRVLNLTNDLAVDVRINDRGPFVDGRIIDLSRAAAREIRMLGPGTTKVRVRILAMPEKFAGYFAVQAGSFRNRGNAERLRERMEREHGEARIVRRDGDPTLWRVQVGRAWSEEEAGELAQKVRGEAGSAFIVRVEAPPAN